MAVEVTPVQKKQDDSLGKVSTLMNIANAGYGLASKASSPSPAAAAPSPVSAPVAPGDQSAAMQRRMYGGSQ